MNKQERSKIKESLPERDPSEVDADIDEYERLLLERLEEEPCDESELSEAQKDRNKKLQMLWNKLWP